MFQPLPLFIGLRYTRTRRRTGFISFISLVSVLGISLGVAALIVVLSVMNGFEKEVRERILGMASHAMILGNGGSLQDWRNTVPYVEEHPQVLGFAPYVQGEGMLTFEGEVSGTMIRGILPDEEPKVSIVGDRMQVGDLTDLHAGGYNIILGAELAAALGVLPGDKVNLVIPQANVTPAGIMPRMRRFTVSGIFKVDMNEYDAALALIHLDDASRLFRLNGGVTGLRLQLHDMYQAPDVVREVARAMPGSYLVTDWTRQHRNFFRALKIEKRIMSIILSLIVMVAAFNIVITVIMVVTEKVAEIAILRTIGLSPGAVMAIFMVQGTVIGVLGTLIGAIGGVTLALNVDVIVPAIEQAFNTQFLPADVYYISEFPSDMHWSDVIVITTVSFCMAVAATLYPSWHASRTQPAEALRYE